MNERILYEERPVMAGDRPFMFALLLLLTPLIIGGLCLLAWYLGTLSNKLTVTESKMRLEQGLFSKRYKEIMLANVRSVEVYQTFWHRMLKTGQIKF